MKDHVTAQSVQKSINGLGDGNEQSEDRFRIVERLPDDKDEVHQQIEDDGG